MDFLRKHIDRVTFTTNLLTQYGLDSLTLSTEEKEKLKSLNSDAFNALITCFQTLWQPDSDLMNVKEQRETNARWLINTLNNDNATEFSSVLEILVNSELIASQQTVVSFHLVPTRTFSRLTTKLSDCTKEEIKAFLQLVIAIAVKNDDTGKNRITEEQYATLLTINGQCSNLIALQRKVIETLTERNLCNVDNISRLFDSLIAYDGSPEQEERLITVFSSMITREHDETESMALRQYVLDSEVFHDLEELKHTLPSNCDKDMQWKAVECLADRVLKEIMIKRLLNSLIVFYDSSNEKKKSLNEALSSMMQTAKDNVELRQYVLDLEVFHDLKNKIPSNCNKEIQREALERLADHVVEEVMKLRLKEDEIKNQSRFKQ